MSKKYGEAIKGAPGKVIASRRRKRARLQALSRAKRAFLGRGRAAERLFSFLREGKKRGLRSLRGRDHDALFVKVRL